MVQNPKWKAENCDGRLDFHAPIGTLVCISDLIWFDLIFLESKKERKARKRMEKKNREKQEGIDMLSTKQKSKIRSKAMVRYFFFTLSIYLIL